VRERERERDDAFERGRRRLEGVCVNTYE